jgi:hypothetical protein
MSLDKYDSQGKFWQDISTIRGLQFMGFTDKKEALEWLAS